jgi:hypothetical protein
MKKIITVCSFVFLISCDNQDTKIEILGEQLDFTKDEIILSDCVFLSNQRYIDSLLTLEHEKK